MSASRILRIGLHPPRFRCQTDDGQATLSGCEVDLAITEQAPFVPLKNGVRVDFVSSRLGNYRYNPVWGLLLDQVWVQ